MFQIDSFDFVGKAEPFIVWAAMFESHLTQCFFFLLFDSKFIPVETPDFLLKDPLCSSINSLTHSLCCLMLSDLGLNSTHCYIL